MRIVLCGVLAAGLLLTQQACTPTDQQSSGPSPAGTPSATSSATPSAGATSGVGTKPTPSAPAGGILAGRRQVVIRPIGTTESIVAIDAHGRLGLTDGEAEHSLFVLTPAGDKYLIKTAKAGAGGEPSCLGVKSNGSDPLTVVATACDAGRAGQQFKITRQKAKDRPGLSAYAISNQGAFLQVFPETGLIAQELGDSPLETTYAFVDNGPSTLPSLD